MTTLRRLIGNIRPFLRGTLGWGQRISGIQSHLPHLAPVLHRFLIDLPARVISAAKRRIGGSPLELELETAAGNPACGETNDSLALLPVKLRRPFDGMSFLLTPTGAPASQAGRLLPPMPANTIEAPKSGAVA